MRWVSTSVTAAILLGMLGLNAYQLVQEPEQPQPAPHTPRAQATTDRGAPPPDATTGREPLQLPVVIPQPQTNPRHEVEAPVVAILTEAGVEVTRASDRADSAVVAVKLRGTLKTDAASLGLLKKLKQLRSVDLSYTALSEAQLKELPDGDQLHRLYLKEADVSDAALQALQTYSQLRVLDLSGNLISNEGLRALHNLKELHELYLGKTKVTDAGLQHLQALRQLRVLALDNTKLTGAGLAALKDMQHMQALYLDESKVNDAGVKTLPELPQLQTLYLDRSAITDASVSRLRALTSLTKLGLAGTKVSESGKLMLQQALPQCYIVWP